MKQLNESHKQTIKHYDEKEAEREARENKRREARKKRAYNPRLAHKTCWHCGEAGHLCWWCPSSD